LPEYSIADIGIEINAPEWTLHDNFKIFECSAHVIDITCNILFEKKVYEPEEQDVLLVKDPGRSIIRKNNFFHTVFCNETDIPYYIIISDDFSLCEIYIAPKYEAPQDATIVRYVRDAIFGVLRMVLIMVLSQRDGLLLHSSTIIWNGMGIAFSGPSGTGKTTHTRLWRKLYDVKILDGDVAALRIKNGSVYAYGLPWCGTSGEFMNERVPLRSIVFLQQAGTNKIKKLDFQEAFMRLIARCFLQPYDEIMMGKYLDIAQKIAAISDCFLLECLPDENAVELVKECLDKE
jgi:hypothetical protein